MLRLVAAVSVHTEAAANEIDVLLFPGDEVPAGLVR